MRTQQSGRWQRETDTSNASYGHISRVDGDRRLAQPAAQNTFFQELCARYPFIVRERMANGLETAFHTLTIDGANSTTCYEAPLSSLRKLREGIVASRRFDAFATEVFETNTIVAVLAKHPDSYLPCMRYLLYTLYKQQGDERDHTWLDELYLLHLSSMDSLVEFFEARRLMHVPDCHTDRLVKARIRGNWILWSRLNKQSNYLQIALIEQGMRQDTCRKAMKIIAASYLSISRAILQSSFGDQWRESACGASWAQNDTDVIFKQSKKLAKK